MADEKSDEIPVKLRPGYTFMHPVTGVALQHSLPDKETGKTEVVAINKSGGREEMPGPFFLLSEKDIEGQWAKFERPTEEELEMLKGANGEEVKIKVAPKPTPMKALHVQTTEGKDAPEDKRVKGPDEKKAPAKKKAAGKGKGAAKKTS
jgi:hypothetical protein